jgi:hypothetical protein
VWDDACREENKIKQQPKIQDKNKIAKRLLWIQQLQKESQKRRINEVKTKRLNFINTNDISLVDNPKIDLNKRFDLIGK